MARQAGIEGTHYHNKQSVGRIELSPEWLGVLNKGYMLPNSGCEDAPLCWECPFPECKLDKLKLRGRRQV